MHVCDVILTSSSIRHWQKNMNTPCKQKKKQKRKQKQNKKKKQTLHVSYIFLKHEMRNRKENHVIFFHKNWQKNMNTPCKQKKKQKQKSKTKKKKQTLHVSYIFLKHEMRNRKENHVIQTSVSTMFTYYYHSTGYKKSP